MGYRKTEWQDATGYCYAEIRANDADPPWPSMVELADLDLGSSSILSDDARSLAALLVAAADEADKRNKEAFSSGLKRHGKEAHG